MRRTGMRFLLLSALFALWGCGHIGSPPAPPMKESSPEPAPDPQARAGTPAPDAVPGVPSVSPETIALAEAVSKEPPPPTAVVIEPPAAPTPAPEKPVSRAPERVVAQERPVAMPEPIVEAAPMRAAPPPGPVPAAAPFNPVPIANTPVYPLPVAKARPASRKGQPFPDAAIEQVHINAFVTGNWRRTPGGYEWRLRLQSPGASSLGFVASPVRLSGNSLVLLQSSDGRSRQGPFAGADLAPGQPFQIPSVPGSEADLIIQLPPESDMAAFAFVVQQAYVGYKDGGVTR